MFWNLVQQYYSHLSITISFDCRVWGREKWESEWVKAPQKHIWYSDQIHTPHIWTLLAMHACVHACARTCMRACVCVYVFYLYVCMYVCLCSCDVVATHYTCFMSHTLPPLTTSPDKHKPVSGKVEQFPVMSVEATKRKRGGDRGRGGWGEWRLSTWRCVTLSSTPHTYMREVYYSQCVESEMIH